MMLTHVIGFGWTAWVIPETLINACRQYVSDPVSSKLSKLLTADDQRSRNDVVTLYTDLLAEIEACNSLEGLIGLQTPLLTGQTTERGSEPEGPNVHQLMVLAAALHTIMTGWHISDVPVPISIGGMT